MAESFGVSSHRDVRDKTQRSQRRRGQISGEGGCILRNAEF